MNRARATSALAALVAAGTLPARAQTAAYKIGATYPLTGPFAATFNEYLKGAVIAVEDVNAAGGVKGRKLELVIEDSLGNPQGGIAAMRKVTQVDGVQAILTILTNVVSAQIPLADEIKVPTMSTVETPGLFAKSEYSFAHAPTWGLTLPMMVAYWKAHGVKRAFGMLTNNNIGLAQSAAARDALAGIGAQYDEGLIEATQTDFRGTVARAAEMKPDIILITGQGGQNEIAAIKQIREMGVRTQIWNLGQNFTSRSYRDAIGPYSEGLYYGGMYLDPNASPAFVKRYRTAIGSIPAYAAGETYDIIKIYAAAIAKGGYRGPAIRDFVATLKGMPSVLGGTIEMGPDHFTKTTAAGFFQVRSGKLVRLSS